MLILKEHSGKFHNHANPVEIGYNSIIRQGAIMEIEAGMNMENLGIIGAAFVRLLDIWWPIVVFSIVGVFIVDMKAAQMKEIK
jgi:hypothetical protein